MEYEGKLQTVGVLTSGGDAPGMNAAIRAVVRRALAAGLKVKGILKGYEGLIGGEIVDMHAKDVSGILDRGGTVLYSARCKDMYEPAGVQMAAAMCRRRKIDALVVIGGDGSLRAAEALADQGIRVIGVPGTIDLDLAYTEYSIGFDSAVNTAMRAIDNIRDTSASHERCSIIEVMGRSAGYIALWCGIANGAEDILLPETYDHDEKKLCENIIDNRRRGKTHHIIVNAEGIGGSAEMARRIEEATGVPTRATILGHMQRGGSPSARDRVAASILGARAVDLLLEGKSCRAVGYRHGRLIDDDLHDALAMEKVISPYDIEIARALSHNYYKTEIEGMQDKID